MLESYATFLATKAPVARATGIEPLPMDDHLFDFQQHCVAFALRQGRAALFMDTGLGKSRMQLEFCHQAASASNGYALILTPLAVARQIEREGLSLGYDVRLVRDGSEVRPGINICNYDRLDLLDVSVFGAVSLDESSILKSYTGSTTRKLIEAFANTRFRLCATATPAPNDHTELGTQAEFLGIMTHAEMLVRWFINDSSDTGQWRLKGHAERDFWDWMTSWARVASSPADLGFDGSRFSLEPMVIHRHKVIGDARPAAGALFAADISATNMHQVKRQTAGDRAEAVRGLTAAEPSEPWVVWCDTDYEADALASVMPNAVEVRGSQSPDQKEAQLAAFSSGQARIIITKPKIAGMGLNWQHSARMAFAGRCFSYEAWYQAVRRCWRFGQTRQVHVHLIVAEGEDQIGRVITRKAGDHAVMKAAMSAAMVRAHSREAQVKIPYVPSYAGRLPSWL